MAVTLTLQFDTPRNLMDFFQLIGSAGALKAQLDRVEDLTSQVLDTERMIMANEQQLQDALTRIDQATTKAGTSLQGLSETTTRISDEVDAMKTALQNAGVSQQIIDQASALGDRLTTVTDSLDQHATFLNAIASKGATDPVPVEPPPPPPEPTPTPGV